jgi:hypothetical protein
MTLEFAPLDLASANEFVRQHHRHHQPVVGHKFSLAAILSGAVVGVAIVGRPVARSRDDGMTLEVTRLATDGVERPTGRLNRHGDPTFHNPCSFLYGAAARAAFALGYRRIGTYILASEPGTSLDAAGWRQIGAVKGRSWSCDSRPRIDKHPTSDKLLFERVAA